MKSSKHIAVIIVLALIAITTVIGVISRIVASQAPAEIQPTVWSVFHWLAAALTLMGFLITMWASFAPFNPEPVLQPPPIITGSVESLAIIYQAAPTTTNLEEYIQQQSKQ